MKPEILSSKIIYTGYFSLRTDLLQRQDGETVHYTSVIMAQDAAVILAEDPQGRLILNREYRQPARTEILSCPGGTLEPNEDPLLGGQREMLEETGYFSDDIRLLGCCYTQPGLCNQKIYYLYAKNAVFKGTKNLDPFEFIETELLTEQELKQAILAGRPIDSILCTALLYKSLYQSQPLSTK